MTRESVWKTVTVLLVISFITGAVIGGTLIYSLDLSGDTEIIRPRYEIPDSLDNTSKIFSGIYMNMSDSVVSVKVMSETEGGVQYGQGSGFIYDEDRHVVTNQHVIDDASEIDVVFSNGVQEPAYLVGSDKYSDIAVLKVSEIPEGGSFTPDPLKMADSSNLVPGQQVVAIGNPFGLAGSITHGIVSATGRLLSTEGGYSIPNVVQTDAPLNPGNSGGPLLNMKGEVVGVNRAKEGDNVGFAIPSNKVKRVADSLIETGEYDYTWLGITMLPVSDDIAEYMDLSEEVSRGIMVIDVVENGPADNASFQGAETKDFEGKTIYVDGDIIVEIDNERIRSNQELIGYLDKKSPGDIVVFTLYRDGILIDKNVTLGTRPG